MSEEKKAVALNENTLEDVSGGGFKEAPPVLVKQCPCGANITYESSMDRVQCSSCGRWFRVVLGMLIEENQG